MNLSRILLAICMIAWVSISGNPASPMGDEREVVMLLDGDEVEPISVEEYVARAVAHEMPYTFHPEALKAQAVAARTYLLYCLTNNSHPHAIGDVCTDITHCGGYITEEELAKRYGAEYAAEAMDAARLAAYSTKGEILRYDGEPILSVWHSSSSGTTEDCGAVWLQELPYLVSVDTPETVSASTVSYTIDDAAERLRDAGYSYDLSHDVWQSCTASGRCASLSIGNITLGGNEARFIFSLRSTDFTVYYNDGSFYFNVAGYGHGVGMSQYGADAMARTGASYRDILTHYYTGSDIS